jgi:hypothetical protein
MRDREGSALLIALLVLSIFSLLGMIMSIEAVTGFCISDNYESRMRAETASIAGLNHAHLLMRGLSNDDFLKGPDGAFSQEPAYLEYAREYAFRNPLPISVAQMLDISNPAADLTGFPDDGLINTGRYLESNGIPLIPVAGIAVENSTTEDIEKGAVSRYFVKVTDNNGDDSETLKDPNDSPFADGDGEIIVRSMGIARTHTAASGSGSRKNSVVLYEGRFRRFSAFDLGPAVVVAGSGVVPLFGTAYVIDGGASPGIGVLDADGQDAAGTLRSAASGGIISGAGLAPPSVVDLTPAIAADRQKESLLDAGYLHEFVTRTAPEFADAYYAGNQSWSSPNAPDLGFYDAAKPSNAPEQRPVATVVHGDLEMTGNVSGGGLLVVTGKFECLDSCRYTGLVLVIGRGEATLDTEGPGITGGLFVAGLSETGSRWQFVSPVLSVLGNSRVTADGAAVDGALGLVPSLWTGFREIAGVDP